MNKGKTVVHSIVNKKSRYNDIDCYYDNTSVAEQAIKKIEYLGGAVKRVMIETETKKYYVDYDV